MTLAALALALAPLASHLAPTPLRVDPEPPPARGPVGGVLVVDLDDVGVELLHRAHTPTLDRLEVAGRTFPRFYATGFCTPSRAQLHLGASGGYPGVDCMTKIGAADLYRTPHDVIEPLGVAASNAGLTTAKVGKWHLAPAQDVTHVHDFGWQEYRGVPFNLRAATGDYYSFAKVVNGATSQVSGTYLTTDETDDAIDYVRQGVDLISVSYHAIHRPYHTPPPGLFTIPSPTTDVELAIAMLEALDHELGRLLREARMRDYTALVFSDNGGRTLLRGRKSTLRERGMRTRLWAMGPGVVPGIDTSLLSAVDLYATSLDLLGVPTGPTTRGPDSISFASTLGGGPGRRDWVFAESAPVNGADASMNPATWRRAAVGGRYKLVRNVGGPGESLFDLESDADERNDLLDVPLTPGAMAAYARLRDVLDRFEAR